MNREQKRKAEKLSSRWLTHRMYEAKKKGENLTQKTVEKDFAFYLRQKGIVV